ncbi:MAG: hypothetical protein KDB79_12085 [Acidobacteria bacterium]|nr:hypothetical protein [Acidobacteriota bacterium]
MKVTRRQLFRIVSIIFWTITIASNSVLCAQQRERSVFLRLRVEKPTSSNLRVTITGYRHDADPWRYEPVTAKTPSGQWTEWIDLSAWKWHGKISRAGGIAEYPSIMLTVVNLETNQPVNGCDFEVELGDAPSKDGTVISFKEEGDRNSIIFLAPYPIRKNAGEFETGRQMAARRAEWARSALGGNPPFKLKHFEMIADLWTQYDDQVVSMELQTLRSLGFNVVGGVKDPVAIDNGMKTSRKSGLYLADPELLKDRWSTLEKARKNSHPGSPETKKADENIAYYEISDEISAINLKAADKQKLDGWFRAFLKLRGINGPGTGINVEMVEYPILDLYRERLPKDIPLERRRLLFYAAKFGQWWSARQLNLLSGLIHQSFPDVPTGTLLPSHGFLGDAWGPQHIGMSYRMLDYWELAEQKSVDQLSSEDWLGLNHMYGPQYTWSGGQTFGYLNALVRSAIARNPITMRTYLTPSDENYLLLKAHSALGQGVKSFNFWSYGPTMVSTENYWSDLRSEYEGIAKLNRSLAGSEEILYPAKTVSDPVAILYSVSHDIWNNDQKAVFAERRLLWHGLRHLQIQPDLLREEDIESGKLKDYKVLYVTDWNISRAASAAIDKWIKNGGVIYLSAGAATRDEFNEPYKPGFSNLVWEKQTAAGLTLQNGSFNERVDLPRIKPITTALSKVNGKDIEVPVIGVRAEMNSQFEITARFSDGKPAGKYAPYGRGKIFAFGFMPMLAYGKLANFQPTTLAEEWKPEPRELIGLPLAAAAVRPVAKSDTAVVETNFLDGKEGGALVFANYTYKPITSLGVEVKTRSEVCSAKSASGAGIKILSKSAGDLRLNMPLGLVEIVTFKYCPKR